MQKKKKIKKVTIEKYKYDNDDYGYVIEPTLLLKLLEWARWQSPSEEELQWVPARMDKLARDNDDWCFDMSDWASLVDITPTVEAPVEPTVPASVIKV